MSTSEVASNEKRFFRRECRLNEENITEGLKRIADIHKSPKQVDVGKISKEVGDSMHTVSDRWKTTTRKIACLRYFGLAEGSKTGPGEAKASFKYAAFKPRSFRDEVRERVG